MNLDKSVIFTYSDSTEREKKKWEIINSREKKNKCNISVLLIIKNIYVNEQWKRWFNLFKNCGENVLENGAGEVRTFIWEKKEWNWKAGIGWTEDSEFHFKFFINSVFQTRNLQYC